MRITNQMSANKMLTSINRNLTLVDLYNTQGSTGKLITVPSDDPIIASRSLKYSTMLSENNQYAKNAAQATSWVDSTESVFNNIEQSILIDMKGSATNAANDTYSTADRLIVLTQLSELTAQLEQELNTDYMGRNLFSGYKTDEKPIIQDENGKNILNPLVYGTNGQVPVEPARMVESPEGSGYYNLVSDSGAATMIDNEYTTGGYILDPDGSGQYIRADMSETEIDGQLINIQVGSGVTTEINTLVTEVYSADDYIDIRGGYYTDGTIVDPSLRDPNDPTQMINPIPDDYEPLFPSLPDGFTYEGDTEFERIINFLSSDEYNNMTDEEKVAWDNLPENDLQALMSDMITVIEDLSRQVSAASTSTGVRSTRIDMVETRLADDNLNITSLQSKNEDANLAYVAMYLSVANTALQASLNLGMKVNQTSLVDYLR